MTTSHLKRNVVPFYLEISSKGEGASGSFSGRREHSTIYLLWSLLEPGSASWGESSHSSAEELP